MKTFVKYPGGKTEEVDVVKRYMPANINRYFEPFVGGGAVFLGLAIGNSNINDYSTDLINLYTSIKERDEDFINYLREIGKIWVFLGTDSNISEITAGEVWDKDAFLKEYAIIRKRKDKTILKLETGGNVLDEENLHEMEITVRKDSYYKYLRGIYNKSPIDSPLHTATYYFLREFCYSSMFRFNGKGEFNVPYGGMSYNDKDFNEKIEYMFSEDLHSLLEKTAIYNLDFEEFFDMFEFRETDFIFLDPPYDSDFSTYDKHPFDKGEQKRLFENLSKIKAKWMLVIKSTDFIDELYANYNKYTYDKKYQVSFKNRNDKKCSHLLITNYNLEGF